MATAFKTNPFSTLQNPRNAPVFPWRSLAPPHQTTCSLCVSPSLSSSSLSSSSSRLLSFCRVTSFDLLPAPASSGSSLRATIKKKKTSFSSSSSSTRASMNDPVPQSTVDDNRIPVTVITGFLGAGKACYKFSSSFWFHFVVCVLVH